MTSYTDVFGGENLNPVYLNYNSFTMAASQTLLWPEEGQVPSTNQQLAAAKIDVTASAGSLTITLPSALLVSVGQDMLVRNVGATTFSVVDAAAGAVATVAAGEAWLLVLKTNATAAGTWYALEYGVGSSSADAAALAGLGLVAITTTLNQSHPYEGISSTPYSVVAGDRAQALVWTGGAGEFDFAAAATLGSTWFALVKNAGTGDLVLDPNGAETIDDEATITLIPDESCFVLSDGTNLYTVGRGRSLITSVSFSSIALPASGTTVLTDQQVAARVQTFTGTLTGNSIVEYGTSPGYWMVRNATSGVFTLTGRVNGADTGVIIPQGMTVLLQSDGTNLRWAHDPFDTVGIVARTAISAAAANPFTSRVLTGTANQVDISNGNGVSGNPTFTLSATIVVPGSISMTGANVNFTFSPTGTGTGAIAPATAGSIDNMTIGGTTPLAGAFTTLSATTPLPITSGGTGLATANLVVQRARGETASSSTITSAGNVIPLDDTIPQQTEGAEVLTASITPKNASNVLLVEFGIQLASDNVAATQGAVAIFRDAMADALFATFQGFDAASKAELIVGSFSVVAGSTSSTTFKLRAGPQNGSQTLTYNGSAGARIFGGVSLIWINITEFTP